MISFIISAPNEEEWIGRGHWGHPEFFYGSLDVPDAPPGLSHQEAAEALSLSRGAADRLWALSRAWLFRQLSK